MTDEGGGEDVDGVDWYPGNRLTTTIIDGRWVQGLDVEAGGTMEVVFEGGLVDDDVDQRLDHPHHPGTSGGDDHCQHGVEASLPIGAFQQRRAHRLAPLFDAVVPLGAELCVAELGGDLVHHRPGSHTNT